LANNARKTLRRRLTTTKAGATRKSRRWPVIKDDRQIKGPLNTFGHFLVDRMATGDFKNIDIKDRSKLLSKEWSDISASEKKVSSSVGLADK
jgi:hypothetical protein